MEPITYLTGLGTAIAGYIWFLWHNREVSYRTVLTETTSKRQHKLYAERGFNIEHYQELIEDAKDLRKEIKRVACDYDLTWDQGDTDAGKQSKRALQIVRKVEAREQRRAEREEDEDEEVGFVTKNSLAFADFGLRILKSIMMVTVNQTERHKTLQKGHGNLW